MLTRSSIKIRLFNPEENTVKRLGSSNSNHDPNHHNQVQTCSPPRVSKTCVGITLPHHKTKKFGNVLLCIRRKIRTARANVVDDYSEIRGTTVDVNLWMLLLVRFTTGSLPPLHWYTLAKDKKISPQSRVFTSASEYTSLQFRWIISLTPSKCWKSLQQCCSSIVYCCCKWKGKRIV